MRALVWLGLILLSALPARAGGKYFDRAIIVIFENEDFAVARKQPFFKWLASEGADLVNFMALTHPSQGNYVGLTSGTLGGVVDDGNVDLNLTNIVDLLEAKGVSWRVYAENFPGDCFAGETSGDSGGVSGGDYARKHNPFISFNDIRLNPSRCAKIVDAERFDADVASGTLPQYVFYIPNLQNDGHDTGVEFADRWYAQKFGPLVRNASFMKNTVLISTFDESGPSSKNQIYTSIKGPGVKPGPVSTPFNTYSLLALIEENWSLGNLGRGDLKATPISGIWTRKRH